MTTSKGHPETPADRIRSRVERRATHRDAEDVSKTLSDWSVAQLVASEYHGRFLIELLQNARDAFLEAWPGSADGEVRIRLTSEPALLVANQGSPMPTDVLLLSIGRFGQGTKTEGESIGHKGIGFKSVLEVSMTPEIYSGRAGDDFSLAVRFDPDDAIALVHEKTPDWDDLVRQVPGGSDPALVRHVPVLQYPIWVDDPGSRLGDAVATAGRAFDTVIRLPYDERFDDDLSVTREGFIAKARQAMSRVSDQIVLLLGAFSEIRIDNDVDDEHVVVRQRQTAARDLPGGGVRREVLIQRDGRVSSKWLAFERRLPGFEGMEGDLTVAVRIGQGDAGDVLALPALDVGDGGDAFHLFFPTQITTHLPFCCTRTSA